MRLTNNFVSQDSEIICINTIALTHESMCTNTGKCSGKVLQLTLKTCNDNSATREACGKFISVWELAIDYRKYIFSAYKTWKHTVGLYILHVSSVSIYTHTHTIERSESFLVQQKTSKCL